MVTTKLNLSMTEPSVRQIYAKQGDTGRVLDISLDQTPEDGTLRILRPDGVEVTSEAVTGGEVESGSSFESLTEADVTELTVGIEPVQDLNGYDAPWVGGAGSNKWDEQWEVGNITTIGTDGTSTDRIRSKEYIPVSPNTAYYRVSPNNLQPFYYDANKAFLSYGTWGVGAFTTPANASYVRFQVDPAYGTTYKNNIAINYPSSATSYAPYSNICPITGHDEVRVTRTGINVWDEEWELGGISSATGINSSNTSQIRSKNYIAILPNTQYYFYVGDVGEGARNWQSRFYDAEKNYIGVGGTLLYNAEFTPPSNARYVRFAMQTTYGTTYKNDISINYPSTDTEYHAYDGNTYTTSLGQTVYGGTLDMVTGVLTVDKAMVTIDGTQAIQTNGATSTSSHFFYTPSPTKKNGVANIISDRFFHSSGDVVGNIVGRANGGGVEFYLPLSVAQTVADGKAWFTANPTQICYELATPQTYQLTAQQIKTLVGTNNVWASSGDIVSIKFTYGGLLSELPSDATSVVGKCYCDIEQNGVSSMPFTLNVKKNERAT